MKILGETEQITTDPMGMFDMNTNGSEGDLQSDGCSAESSRDRVRPALAVFTVQFKMMTSIGTLTHQK